MGFGENNEYIKTDVLVIGGGFGGCFAAIKAAEEGAKVVVFEKANILRSGGGGTGIHRTALIHPDYNYSYEEFARLNVEAAGGIADEDLSYEFARDTLDRVLDLESYGVKLRRDDSSFIFMPAADVCPGKPVIWGPGPTVWHDLKPTLAKKAMSYPNVTVLNRTTGVDLLTEDGIPNSRVIGAIGLDTRTGKFVICEAKSVILTSGNACRLGRYSDTLYAPTRFLTTTPPTHCGEGQAMAYRVGADIVNMEFAYLAMDWKDFPHAGVGLIRGVGGKILSGSGIELSHTERYLRAHQGAINNEMPLYADVSAAEGWPEEKGMMQLFLQALENGPTSGAYLQWMKEHGEDLKERPIEIDWRPLAIHNNQPGVHIDTKARSSVEGLYCAGDIIGGGWRQSSAGGFVYGARAGINAAAYSRKAPGQKINNKQVTEIKNGVSRHLTVDPRNGYSWIELEDKVRKIATDYGPPLTSDAKLKQGLVHLERVKTNYLPKLYARNPREMLRACEVKAVFFVAEAFLRAALFRKESRQNNCSLLYKTEYPKQDDKNWLKHTLIQNAGGEMRLGTKDVKRLRKR